MPDSKQRHKEQCIWNSKQRMLPFGNTVFTENMFTAKENRHMHLLLANGTHITSSKYLH